MPPIISSHYIRSTPNVQLSPESKKEDHASLNEEKIVQSLRLNLVKIGMIDSCGNFLVPFDISPQALDAEGQYRFHSLCDSDVSFYSAQGMRLLSMSQGEFIVEFEQKCQSNRISVIPYLRGGRAVDVAGIAHLLEQFFDLYVELNGLESNPLTPLIKKNIRQLDALEKMKLPSNDVDWCFEVQEWDREDLLQVRSLLVEFVAEKFAYDKRLEKLEEFLKEGTFYDTSMIPLLCKHVQDSKDYAAVKWTKNLFLRPLLDEFIIKKLDLENFTRSVQLNFFLNLMIPTRVPLFPLPARYLIASMGNKLDPKGIKTDCIIGNKLQKPYLFQRDNFNLNVSKYNSRLITIESTNLIQMVLDRKLKLVRLEDWHVHDFRACLTAIQLMLQGHVLIEGKCKLHHIWHQAVATKDPYLIKAIIERAKWHLELPLGFLITCFIHLHHTAHVHQIELSDEAMALLNQEIKSLYPKWSCDIAPFYRMAVCDPTSAKWDQNGKGFLTLNLESFQIIFPECHLYPKKNLVIDFFDHFLMQKKNVSLSQEFLNLLIDYLVNGGDRKVAAEMLQPWLNIPRSQDLLSWVKALIPYMYSKGILLWNQIKVKMPIDDRLKALEEIFLLISKERPNTAFMQLAYEEVSETFKRKIFNLLINNPNTSPFIFSQIAEQLFPSGFKPYAAYEKDLIPILKKLPIKEALELLVRFSPFSKELRPIAFEVIWRAALENHEIPTVLTLMKGAYIPNAPESAKISGWLSSFQIGFLRHHKYILALAEFFSLLKLYKVSEIKDAAIDENLASCLMQANEKTSQEAITLFKVCRHRLEPKSNYLALAKHLYSLSQDADVEVFMLAAIKGYPQVKRTEMGIATLQSITEIPEKTFSHVLEKVRLIDGINQNEVIQAFEAERSDILGSKDTEILVNMLENSLNTKISTQKKIIQILLARIDQLSERQRVLFIQNLKKLPEFSFDALLCLQEQIDLMPFIPFLQYLNEENHPCCQEKGFLHLWQAVCNIPTIDSFQLLGILRNPYTEKNIRHEIFNELLAKRISSLSPKEMALMHHILIKEPMLFFDKIVTSNQEESSFLSLTMNYLYNLHQIEHALTHTVPYKKLWDRVLKRQDPSQLMNIFNDFSLMRSLYGELKAYRKTEKWIKCARQLKLDEKKIQFLELSMNKYYAIFNSLRLNMKVILKTHTSITQKIFRALELEASAPAINHKNLKYSVEQTFSNLEFKLLNDEGEHICNYPIMLSMLRQVHLARLIPIDEYFKKLEKLFHYNLKFPFDSDCFGFDLLYEHLESIDFIDFNPYSFPCTDEDLQDWNKKRNEVLSHWIDYLTKEGDHYQGHVNFLNQKGEFKIPSIASLQLVDSLSGSLKSFFIQCDQDHVMGEKKFRLEITKRCSFMADKLIHAKLSLEQVRLDPVLRCLEQLNSFSGGIMSDPFYQRSIMLLTEWVATLNKRFSKDAFLKERYAFLNAFKNELEMAHDINSCIREEKEKMDQGLILHVQFLTNLGKKFKRFSTPKNYLENGPYGYLNLNNLHDIEKSEIVYAWQNHLSQSSSAQDRNWAVILGKMLQRIAIIITPDIFMGYIFERQRTLIKLIKMNVIDLHLINCEVGWIKSKIQVYGATIYIYYLGLLERNMAKDLPDYAYLFKITESI